MAERKRLSGFQKKNNQNHVFLKAILFINGCPPSKFPKVEKYQAVFCTDGAYSFVSKKGIKPDYVIGDFDSVKEGDVEKGVRTIKVENQNFTDFHKCLDFIVKQGFTKADVYGGTGKESDHFLGNISTAFAFKQKLNIRFHDDFFEFYFSEKETEIIGVKDRVISLYPFPYAKKVNSVGLAFPLNSLDLDIRGQIGTRNHAIENEIKISYIEGELLIFISKNRLTKEELKYKETH